MFDENVIICVVRFYKLEVDSGKSTVILFLKNLTQKLAVCIDSYFQIYLIFRSLVYVLLEVHGERLLLIIALEL